MPSICSSGCGITIVDAISGFDIPSLIINTRIIEFSSVKSGGSKFSEVNGMFTLKSAIKGIPSVKKSSMHEFC
jgi:hypothetical protein